MASLSVVVLLVIVMVVVVVLGYGVCSLEEKFLLHTQRSKNNTPLAKRDDRWLSIKWMLLSI